MTFHFCNVALQWTTIQAQQICYGKAPTLWSKKMKSSSQIATLESARIAKRLYNHWKHKFEVKESEQQFEIIMPEAQVSLIPHTEYLAVEITASVDKMDHLEKVVLDHLSRMAQQEFEAEWQRS